MGIWCCLLYTSDAADEARSVDLGGRRIIKKVKKKKDSNVRSAYKYEYNTKKLKMNDGRRCVGI
ncbi:hypothetical protein PVA38_10970 [Streptococcus pneumoniae D39]|nr:hypothetical protein PVA38_10970 [Streptococcus pneumoniae D39]